MTSVAETPSNEDSSIILTIFFQEKKGARPIKSMPMTCNQSLPIGSPRPWIDKPQSLNKLTKDGKPSYLPGFEVPEGIEINPITMKLREADFDVTLRKKELPAEVPRSATPTDKATPTDNDSSTPTEDATTSTPTDNATPTDNTTSTDNATPTDIATPNDSPTPTDTATPTANTMLATDNAMSIDTPMPAVDANPIADATPTTDNATPADNATPTDNSTPTDNAIPIDHATPTDKTSPATEGEEDEDSESIQVVKKDNVFGAEMTQSEMDIIQQRVARQQQQFAEYEYKEKVRKLKKVYSIFDYLTIEEMEEMLSDCKNDEDEAVVRMTEPTYLLKIRKVIACRFTANERSHGRNPASKMTGSQLEAYQRLLSKRSATLKKTTNEMAKKQYRLGGRLALDDALRQVQEQGMEKSTAFEGWSAARIRAYNLIDQNPNSYYYRFNAPGEIQRKGQWAPDERKLFFDRLEEVGANGQWGHFAMTIPGRVGYQCSNFYRLLVENGEVDDPNYVLDEKGKAHYLFDKKNANGTVEKTFRTHNKHGRSDPSDNGGTTTTTRRKRTSPAAPTNGTTANGGTTTSKRKRRTHRWGSDDDDEDDNMFADWEDNSGAYTSSTTRGTRTSSRRTRARTTFNDDEDEEMEEDFDDSTSSPPATVAAAAATTTVATDTTTDATIETTEQPPVMEEDELEDEYYDATQGVPVLPGFIDPITLDEVEKPAISKYGHVMGYDSWMRCLTNWEGKRNICPLTKKPLSKRDLVVLTFDNIEEYRDQILNM